VVHLRTGDVAVEITSELLAGKTRTHFNTFAVRAEHMRALGGCREYFESAEDIDLQLRLAGVCRVWYEPVLVQCYRLHDNSITHTVAAVRREFFDDLAREMSRERFAGRLDAVERGEAPEPPPGDTPARKSQAQVQVQVQGMLIGEAWRIHRGGDKRRALRVGLRALSRGPRSLRAWRSIAALFLKRAGRAPDS
jgi:hypothetical protein